MAAVFTTPNIWRVRLRGMNTLPQEDTRTPEIVEHSPITQEHRLRPPVSLEAEPNEAVPVWEPGEGDFS
jgi:hypothetical protein